jgi:hypothetical protein
MLVITLRPFLLLCILNTQCRKLKWHHICISHKYTGILEAVAASLLHILVITKWTIAFSFLGAFTKSRKVTITFVMSVCPSLRLHGTTWLPLSDFDET